MLVAVFTVPLIIDTQATDPFSLTKLTVLYGFTVIGTSLVLVHTVQWRRPIGIGKAGWAALAFGAVGIVACIYSIAPRISILGAPLRYGGAVPYLLYILFMFLVVWSYRDVPDRVRNISWAATVAGTVMGLYVLVQAAGWDWLPWVDASSGGAPQFPIGTVGNSDFAGGLLAIMLPVGVSLFVTSRYPKVRLTLGACLAIETVALWETQSRGGIAAAFIGLIAMTLVVRIPWRRWMIVSIGLGLAAVIGLLGVLVQAYGYGSSSGPAISRTSTLRSRVAYWDIAIRVIESHPLLGTGQDTFYPEYIKTRSHEEAVRAGSSLTDEPHNILLGVGATEGLTGLLAFLFLLGICFRLAGGRLRDGTKVPDLLLLGAFGGLVAYVVQGFVSIEEPPLPMFAWLLMAIIVIRTLPAAPPGGVRDRNVQDLDGREEWDSSAGKDKICEGNRRRFGVAGFALLCAIVGTLCCAALFVGTLPMRASTAARRGDFLAAMRLDPWNSTYAVSAGEFYEETGLGSESGPRRDALLERANTMFLSALADEPGDVRTLVLLAELDTRWAETTDSSKAVVAGEWWAKVLQLDRANPTTAAEYASVRTALVSRGRYLVSEAEAMPGDAARWISAAEVEIGASEADAARDALRNARADDPSNTEVAELSAKLAG